MEFSGFSGLLSGFVAEAIFNSEKFEKIVFEQLDNSALEKDQVLMIKTYYRLAKTTGSYRPVVGEQISKGIS
jgi:hypothetical protein